MGYLKRLSTTLQAHFDRVVAQMENHDAMVNAALGELQMSSSRALLRLRQVRADGAALREDIGRERKSMTRWRERAARATDAEGTALECLRRARRSAVRIEAMERRLLEHDDSEAGLEREVTKLRERLRALIEKRNVLRTREASAQAQCAIASVQGGLDNELDVMFDRWEQQVGMGELACHGQPYEHDRLEAEFDDEEERASLEEELARLRQRVAS